MQHELTITAPNQSGFFAKIMMAVRRHGCQPTEQRRDVRGDSQIVTLIISGAESLVEALAEDIKAIGSGINTAVTAHGNVIHAGRQDAGSGTKASAPRSAFLSKLVKDNPNLADLVKQAETEPDENEAENILASIGDRMGRRVYAKNYSLGSPLKLQAALPRMVVPAMKPYVSASVENEAIVIPSCSFCNHDPAQRKMCGFLQGFISGLLHSASTTAAARVELTGCVLKGHASCRFEVS